ncbi:C4-type zinc ribbon domain-containing protein [Pendulispora rubella]|uniref:C4-type zinc ribbon domain-containing protein n=1 Tax=Pendulispora rubella TaxID=2741070 RepID=A0ABZ2LL57_9BACT
MSITEQIRSLEELASVDAELKILEDQLTQERSTLDALRGSLEKLEDKLKTDRAHIAALDKTRSDLVAEVRQMNQQIEHSREKMNRSRNEREANAAQRELEELRKLLRDREEEIGKLTTEAEGARQQIESTEGEASKISAELGSQEGDISSRLSEVEAQKAKRVSDRQVAMKKLPPVLYRRYDQIRSKRGTGIAQTSDGTCKACNMALPPQLFHRLRREPLLDQCPSCNRIIYFVSPAAAAQPVKEG